MADLRFLGGARTVTGSKFLLESGASQTLVDCGLFQGPKELRLRNWEAPRLDVGALSSVLLTHAHIDHTGYLPRLLRAGFRGDVFATEATADLTAILLPDSGHLHEEEAAYHNRKGTSRHRPALPLYTEEDGRRAAARIRTVAYGVALDLAPGMTAVFRRAGHILGSSHVRVDLERRRWRRSVLFSGDLGPYDSPLLPDPEGVGTVDYLVVESTYGDRIRDPESPVEQLARVVLDLARAGGALVVPAFTVGRTQVLLHHLATLEETGRVPRLPVFVDSPTAIDATQVYRRHPHEFDGEIRERILAGREPLATARTVFTRTPEESKAINRIGGPLIIISGSGMATGGRVLHHLRQRLPDPRSVVLLVGYQAFGTRGWRLLNGEKTVRIFGEEVPVEARVESIMGFSAHADREGLLRWLGTATRPPRRTFLVHGDPQALEALEAAIGERLGWPVRVPDHEQRVVLD